MTDHIELGIEESKVFMLSTKCPLIVHRSLLITFGLLNFQTRDHYVHIQFGTIKRIICRMWKGPKTRQLCRSFLWNFWWFFLHSAYKVRTFWETHKTWKNLPHGFDKSADLLSKHQNHEEDFFKLCVLLKKSELYLENCLVRELCKWRTACIFRISNKNLFWEDQSRQQVW